MLWRSISALVILFWAVMTGLLIRDTYFPADSEFTKVPPKVVLNLFLNQTRTFNTTLHLYRDEERIGHASFQVTRGHVAPDAKPVYEMFVTGVVEKDEGGMRRSDMNWRAMLELEEGERCVGMDVIGRWLSQDVSVSVHWDPAEAEAPELEVRRGDEVVVDSRMVQAMLAMGGGGLGGLGSVEDLAGMGGLEIAAREGSMELAGRERKCFVVTFQMGTAMSAEAVFTEVGELALVRLPNELKLLDPTMFGLQPELEVE